MSTEKMTFAESVDSLNGFEEIAIEKRFDFDIYVEGDAHPAKGMRAVAMVLFKRDGLDDAAAYDKAMRLPGSGLKDVFADEPEEVFADEPLTVVGKDEPAPSAEQTA